MSFRFACSDATFPLLPHEKAFRLIKLLDFQGVDIGLFEQRSEVQPSMVLDDPVKNGLALRKKAEECGLLIADVFYQAACDFTIKAINHPDPTIRKKERENFERTLDYALACDSYHMTILPGVHYEDESYDDSLSRTSEELFWRLEKTQKAGIEFGVEAHIGSIVETPEQTQVLLNKTPGLMLTLDYTHFIRQGISNERVHPLIRYASHFHARGATAGKLQTILSENTIDYAKIVEEMKTTEYKGFFGIEYTWTDWERCNRTDNVSESILLMKWINQMEG